MINAILTFLEFCAFPLAVLIYGFWAVWTGSLNHWTFVKVGGGISLSLLALGIGIFLSSPWFNPPPENGGGLNLGGPEWPLFIAANGALGLIAVVVIAVSDGLTRPHS